MYKHPSSLPTKGRLTLRNIFYPGFKIFPLGSIFSYKNFDLLGHPTFSDHLFSVVPLCQSSTCVSRDSVQFSLSVVSESLWSHEPQHTRPLCPSPTPGVHRKPCPLSQWCHRTISSSVVPFSSCPQSLPASGSFQMSQLFASGGQSIGVSTSKSFLPMNTQDWSPLEWTGCISLQSKGLSRVLSKTTVQKHQFFGSQLAFKSNSQIHTWPLENQ